MIGKLTVFSFFYFDSMIVVLFMVDFFIYSKEQLLIFFVAESFYIYLAFELLL